MQLEVNPDAILILLVICVVIFLPLCLPALRTRFAGRVAAIFLGLSAVLLILVALVWDVHYGVSASWFFSLGVWAVGAANCLVVRSRHQSRFALITLGVLTLFVLVQHFEDLSPVKPFKRFFAEIQPGMTEAHVLQILDREFPSDGPFPVPARSEFGKGGISFGLYEDLEAVVIQLDNGRVVSKKYSRD